MKQEIVWEIREKYGKSPVKSHHYLVIGFGISEGTRRNTLRLATWDGNKFDGCDDIVIEKFAHIPF